MPHAEQAATSLEREIEVASREREVQLSTSIGQTAAHATRTGCNRMEP